MAGNIDGPVTLCSGGGNFKVSGSAMITKSWTTRLVLRLQVGFNFYLSILLGTMFPIDWIQCVVFCWLLGSDESRSLGQRHGHRKQISFAQKYFWRVYYSNLIGNDLSVHSASIFDHLWFCLSHHFGIAVGGALHLLEGCSGRSSGCVFRFHVSNRKATHIGTPKLQSFQTSFWSVYPEATCHPSILDAIHSPLASARCCAVPPGASSNPRMELKNRQRWLGEMGTQSPVAWELWSI